MPHSLPGEPAVRIRPADAGDGSLIREMLYDPIHIVDQPELSRYVRGWMKETDAGCIAEVNDCKAGAAWARFFSGGERGYGYTGEGTPELSMAVKAQYRRLGIGQALLENLLRELSNRFILKATTIPCWRTRKPSAWVAGSINWWK